MWWLGSPEILFIVSLIIIIMFFIVRAGFGKNDSKKKRSMFKLTKTDKILGIISIAIILFFIVLIIILAFLRSVGT